MHSKYLEDPQREERHVNLHLHIGSFVSAYLTVVCKSGAQVEYLPSCGVLGFKI